jgi:hypothetical protein
MTDAAMSYAFLLKFTKIVDYSDHSQGHSKNKKSQKINQILNNP